MTNKITRIIYYVKNVIVLWSCVFWKKLSLTFKLMLNYFALTLNVLFLKVNVAFKVGNSNLQSRFIAVSCTIMLV